jgi:hypothetical protein
VDADISDPRFQPGSTFDLSYRQGCATSFGVPIERVEVAYGAGSVAITATVFATSTTNVAALQSTAITVFGSQAAAQSIVAAAAAAAGVAAPVVQSAPVIAATPAPSSPSDDGGGGGVPLGAVAGGAAGGALLALGLLVFLYRRRRRGLSHAGPQGKFLDATAAPDLTYRVGVMKTEVSTHL